VTVALTVRAVRGGYGQAEVLHDVDLDVGEAEVVALLGANGAGKTTLLRALSGTLPVCAGSVDVGGRPLARRSPWARCRAGLAHVPEGRHVFPAMTVRENLQVAAVHAAGDNRLGAVVELFPRLGERLRSAAGNLSGGEQQMLAIGRALMCHPRVLLIDEMSAGLAPVVVHQVVRALADIRAQGTAVLLVEQSPHHVADLVGRVYLLESGHVVDTGTLDALGGADRLAELYLGV
jgi:branched-chain amino acid transport system ATP-binding protein